MEARLEEEIAAVIKFLAKVDPPVFKPITWDSMEVSDPREVLLLASLVPTSFFMKKNKDGNAEPFRVRLPTEFSEVWARDLEAEFEGIFSSRRSKIVRFVQHWVPMWSE